MPIPPDGKLRTLDVVAQGWDDEEDALVSEQPVSTEVWELKHTLYPVNPQLQQKGVGGNWNYSDPRSVQKIIRSPDEQLITGPPPFGTMPLANRAYLTDVLSSAPISRGLIVSGHAKSVLQKFRLGEHQFFPLLVESDEGIHEYDWLQFVNDATPTIAFDRSEFFVQTGFSANSDSSKPTRVDSAEALAKLKAEVQGAAGKIKFLRPKRVVLERAADAPDLFKLGFDIRYYITAPLKRALEYHAVSGLVFKPTRRLWLASET